MPTKNLHLLMTANASQQLGELRNLNQTLQQTSKATDGMKFGFGALAGAAEPLSMLKGLGLNAVSMIPGIGVPMTAGITALEGFNAKMNEVQGGILNTSRAAMVSGAGFEHFQAMMRAGGVDAETLQHGLGKFRVSLEEAAMGNKELAASFANLGLDPVAESAKKSDDAFMDLAEAFQKNENAGNRVSEMHKILGRSYQDLIPLLTRSKSSIDALQEKGLKSGAIVSETQLKALEEAKMSAKAVEEVSTGVQNTIATNWAKIKSGFMIGLTYLGTKKSLKEIVNDVIDAEKNLANQKRTAQQQQAVDLRKQHFDELYAIAEQNNKRIDMQHDADEKMRQSTLSEAGRTFEELRDLQAKMDYMKQNPQPGPLQESDLQRKIDALKEQAAAAVGGLGPLDEFAARLKRIDEMQKADILSADKYARALAGLANSAQRFNTAVPAATIKAGTEQAFQFEAKAQASESTDIVKKILDFIKGMSEKQKKQTEDGDKVKNNIKDIKDALKGVGLAK